MTTTLITVESYPSEAEASAARALLESHGITAALLRDDAAGSDPGPTVARGVRLAVRPRDRVRARDLLRSSGAASG